MTFTVYPAIDVRGGRVVRLLQGKYGRETGYAFEPLARARDYARQGAQWLHLVDLDGARAGGHGLHALVTAIKATTPLRVQAGGGVRSREDVEALLAAGTDRVVVGSVAIRTPDAAGAWLREFGADRLVFALDASHDGTRWTVPSHGWTEASGLTLEALLAVHVGHGLRHLLCTDISRDGTLAGINVPLYDWLRRLAPEVWLQASGGVRGIDDATLAESAGCAGVVIGKALLEGRFTLGDVMRKVDAC